MCIILYSINTYMHALHVILLEMSDFCCSRYTHSLYKYCVSGTTKTTKIN